MKHIGLIAVVAALAAASAHAQQQYEPAVPRGLQESRVEPSGELAQPQGFAPQSFEPRTVQPRNVAPQLVMSPRHHTDSDARQCLQFTSNIQVHRCAERYRARGAAASVTKASVKRSNTVARADRAKASDVAKRDTSQAAEPAKPVDMKSAAAPATTAPAAPMAKSADVGKVGAPAAPAAKSGERAK